MATSTVVLALSREDDAEILWQKFVDDMHCAIVASHETDYVISEQSLRIPKNLSSNSNL